VYLDSVPAINHYAALGGLNAVNFATKSNSATIFVQLKPWDEREKKKKTSYNGVIATITKKLARFKEASVVVISPPAIPGLGNTGGFSFILQEKEAGGDIKNFEKVLNNFVGAVNKRPEIARHSRSLVRIHQLTS
jgi:multidrug efflux pump subunit AcrB